MGLAYRFRHVPSGDAALDRAHAVYEIYLRYYVLGLRWAVRRDGVGVVVVVAAHNIPLPTAA